MKKIRKGFSSIDQKERDPKWITNPLILLSGIRCKVVAAIKECRNVRKGQWGGCYEEEDEDANDT